MEKKQWKCSTEGKAELVSELRKGCYLPPAVAYFFAARGIEPKDVNSYFNATFDDLSDPFRFPDMETAVKRLWDAIRNREQILIHGDYDTDGITATALLSWVLERNGGTVSSFLPHRFDDGYGFTPESLQKALGTCGGKCGVLVTVDCGINSAAAVATANEQKIDVIITDHHEPATDEELPKALAIINPKVHEEVKDLQNLSGVGVAFKLAHAFIEYGMMNNEGGFTTNIQEILDFVALGTIADIVPILGENRILVKYGMEVLRRQARPGVSALIQVAKVDSNIQPSDITFKLAPRINAAGRLGNAITALQLMNSHDIVDAFQYANQLEEFNRARQEKEREIFEEAKRQVEEEANDPKTMAIVAAGENWHPGVIGIVASRFARDYNKPAIVLTIKDGEAHGSGRSIPGLNLIQLLTKCSHLLTRYGGHPMAVGLGLSQDKIAEFKKEFEQRVSEEIQPQDLVSCLNYDGAVELSDLGDEFYQYYSQLGPFGHGNTHPVYRINNVEIIRTFPIRGGHTKGVLRDENGATCQFIAFNMVLGAHTRWDMIVNPHINEFYGEKQRQLQIIDIHPC